MGLQSLCCSSAILSPLIVLGICHPMKKGDSITMTRANQRRLMILNQVAAGAPVNAEGASLLGLSVRQLQRVRAASRKTGAAALSHGNRGRRPSNALEPGVVDRVLELATTKYLGFNQHHLHRDANCCGRWCAAVGSPWPSIPIVTALPAGLSVGVASLENDASPDGHDQSLKVVVAVKICPCAGSSA
jgi:hypothetical protein